VRIPDAGAGRGVAVLLAALLLGCAPGAEPAASPSAIVPLNHLPALAGGYFPIDSAAVGRRFHIYVRLPENYAAQPERRYPVVYLLDGDSLFPILGANHLFMTYDDGLPEAIVVGIAYGGFGPAVNRRGIDFMPPAAGVPAGEAGAPDFQTFLRDELMTRIEREFRADPERRILFGQSRGGGFVIWSAFTDPDLFWARIASNPALEPGREIYFGAPRPASRRDLRLVVASGTRDRPQLRQQALAWFAHWQGRTDLPWTLNAMTIEDGTHAADAPNVYRRAMRWLFPAEARSVSPNR
jgi:predicted alpha/beta superfamily hydrolase